MRWQNDAAIASRTIWKAKYLTAKCKEGARFSLMLVPYPRLRRLPHRNMSTTLGHSRAAFSEPRLWWGDS